MPIDMVGAGVPEDLFKLERRPGKFLLYFGRLDVFHKGLDTLLEAVAIMVGERPDTELRIAGRGKDAERVSALAKELGIERERISLADAQMHAQCGRRHQPSAQIQASRLYARDRGIHFHDRAFCPSVRL